MNSAQSQNASSAVSEEGVSGEGCSFLYQPLHQKEVGNETFKGKECSKIQVNGSVLHKYNYRQRCFTRNMQVQTRQKKLITSFIREKY